MYTISTKEEKRVKTEIEDMMNSKLHNRWTQVCYTGQKYFIRRDNTLYYIKRFYNEKQYLDNSSPLFQKNDYMVYIPMATIEKGERIGYLWERANTANWLLTFKAQLKNYYPYLYWCEVGNHPYPKDLRIKEPWMLSQWNKQSHRLIYPDIDIGRAVIFPSLLKG